MSASRDLIGKRFGNLVVTRKLKVNSHRETEWLCICDCGNEYISTSNRLTTGKTTQCRECSFKQIAVSNTKHGCEPKRLWQTYQNMKTRCNNENYILYSRYGGRGIKVCDEWERSFSSFKEWAFKSGYSDELTLDRIDNDKGYSPENCKWSTVREQANNRHTNRILVLNGVSDTMANWSRKINIPYWVIQERLDRKGWSEERALTEPWKKKE